MNKGEIGLSLISDLSSTLHKVIYFWDLVFMYFAFLLWQMFSVVLIILSDVVTHKIQTDTSGTLIYINSSVILIHTNYLNSHTAFIREMITDGQLTM